MEDYAEHAVYARILVLPPRNFLHPDEIETSDEYKDDDPYVVMDQLESDFQQRRLKATIDLIPSSAKTENLKLLDIGCGEGHFTDVIKKQFPIFEVHGLDYSVSAVDYAHKTFSTINFIAFNRCDRTQIDFIFTLTSNLFIKMVVVPT